jgi:hypothetical protein
LTTGQPDHRIRLRRHRPCGSNWPIVESRSGSGLHRAGQSGKFVPLSKNNSTLALLITLNPLTLSVVAE